MNEEWESSEWDNEIEEEDSSDYYNQDSSREWTESWDKEEDSSDWDESDSSSQIEIIDLIQSRDYDSVEIIRAVIPIKGTYKNDRYPLDNDRYPLDNDRYPFDNNRPFINRGPPNHNPPISLNPHPVNHNHSSLNHPSLNQPPTLNSPISLNPPTTSSPFHGEDITFLNVRLKENKYKPSFFKDLILKEYTTCSICLCNFTNYSKVLSLLCTHYFHSKCIIPWIKKHKQCPCCREVT